ncbi:diacylglycerol acyltransferase-domain-containing protein [Camillea tinctor]|nr:diacylglycerol acyltransferase-domain-containing protein [Camillea tinctor]
MAGDDATASRQVASGNPRGPKPPRRNKRRQGKPNKPNADVKKNNQLITPGPEPVTGIVQEAKREINPGSLALKASSITSQESNDLSAPYTPPPFLSVAAGPAVRSSTPRLTEDDENDELSNIETPNPPSKPSVTVPAASPKPHVPDAPSYFPQNPGTRPRSFFARRESKNKKRLRKGDTSGDKSKTVSPTLTDTEKESKAIDSQPEPSVSSLENLEKATPRPEETPQVPEQIPEQVPEALEQTPEEPQQIFEVPEPDQKPEILEETPEVLEGTPNEPEQPIEVPQQTIEVPEQIIEVPEQKPEVLEETPEVLEQPPVVLEEMPQAEEPAPQEEPVIQVLEPLVEELTDSKPVEEIPSKKSNGISVSIQDPMETSAAEQNEKGASDGQAETHGEAESTPALSPGLDGLDDVIKGRDDDDDDSYPELDDMSMDGTHQPPMPSPNGKIRWAPWNVPLKRRAQTLAVLIHSLCMVTTVTIFFALCANPFAWPLLLIYLLHVLSSKAATDGSLRYRSDWFRKSYLWRLFAGYFPAKLHKTYELPPTRKYIFGYHPHGIISHGAWAAFATDALGFSEKFPGITNSLLTLDSNFRIPFYREYVLASGVRSVSKESIVNILTKGGSDGQGMGRAVTVVVGGARESLEAQPGVLRLILKERKGFIKLAVRVGADLVPVLAFGENELYDQLKSQEHPLVHKIQMLILKVWKFTLPFMHGRGIFNYDVGLMPYRRPLNIVVGKPIQVRQSATVDLEEINRLHDQYVAELQKLWDTHKDEYAPNRKEEIQILP